MEVKAPLDFEGNVKELKFISPRSASSKRQSEDTESSTEEAPSISEDEEVQSPGFGQLKRQRFAYRGADDDEGLRATPDLLNSIPIFDEKVVPAHCFSLTEDKAFLGVTSTLRHRTRSRRQKVLVSPRLGSPRSRASPGSFAQ